MDCTLTYYGYYKVLANIRRPIQIREKVLLFSFVCGHVESNILLDFHDSLLISSNVQNYFN